MASAKYTIKNISSPGRVNVFLRGTFRDVNLFELPDADLDELYKRNNKYVQLASDQDAKTIDTAPIKVVTNNKPAEAEKTEAVPPAKKGKKNAVANPSDVSTSK